MLQPELEHFSTNPLPADAAARASELRAAELQAGQAAAAQTAAARGQQSELFDRATQDLTEANARLAAARTPVNFPVNFAYSSSGCELLNHTVDAWIENDPLEHELSDDKVNMYNETISEESFGAMREVDPDLVPLYRLFYGAPVPIYFCPARRVRCVLPTCTTATPATRWCRPSSGGRPSPLAQTSATLTSG